ncbi:hypothetical protein [Ilumatobacter sp.]|uniref:hypothetical protein n=1 Tax=Ilumatobacter sp. TaxID=1967498 RepID=UPI003B52CAC4
MKKKIAILAVAGTSIGMLASSSSASAAHYCVTDGQGRIHQTNGNGNRGGTDGWRNASPGQDRSPATFDCGADNPPPAPNNG